MSYQSLNQKYRRYLNVLLSIWMIHFHRLKYLTSSPMKKSSSSTAPTSTPSGASFGSQLKLKIPLNRPSIEKSIAKIKKPLEKAGLKLIIDKKKMFNASESKLKINVAEIYNEDVAMDLSKKSTKIQQQNKDENIFNSIFKKSVQNESSAGISFDIDEDFDKGKDGDVDNQSYFDKHEVNLSVHE
jgi:hypothetical protein